MFARECLIEEELQRAETLAAGPTEAFALTEQLMVQAEREDEFAVLERETHAQGIAATSDDHHKAVAAFLAKTGRP